MRRVRKSRKGLLLNFAALTGGAVLFAAAIILINVFSEPGVPLAQAHPEMDLPVTILAYAGIFPFVYGLMGFIITAMSSRGMRVFMEGRMLNGIKVFDSKYKSDTAEGIRQEIQNKLSGQGFLPLGDSETYCRASKGALPDNVFYFASANEFSESADALLSRAGTVCKNVSLLQNGTKSKDTAVMFFLPLNEITNEQIAKIVEFKIRLLDASDALCDICLYSLSEKRAYMTFTTMNIPGQPFKIERGGAVFVNICAGLNKVDFAGVFAKKNQPSILPVAGAKTSLDEPTNKGEAVAHEPPAHMKLNFKTHDVFYPKLRNAGFYCSAVFGGVLSGAFLLMLILWLTVMEMTAMQFFCIFMPVLLLPGLVLIYFAAASYKRLEISRDGATLIRLFGNVKIFEGELFCAEKIAASASVLSTRRQRVFVLYALAESAQNDTVFSVNNYKKYIILKYCINNKKILEELTAN